MRIVRFFTKQRIFFGFSDIITIVKRNIYMWILMFFQFNNYAIVKLPAVQLAKNNSIDYIKPTTTNAVGFALYNINYVP